jgi:hypothetical protein
MRNLIAAAAVALALSPAVGHAQTFSPATQAMTACIQRSTSEADNVVAIRWMFVAIAHHPSVSTMARVSDADRIDANRAMGALFNRLILQDCRAESRAAITADGERALEGAFSAFGERAMTQIMGHPDVTASIAEMATYFDREGFVTLMTQP